MTLANTNDIARRIGSYMAVSNYNYSVFRKAQNYAYRVYGSGGMLV